MKHILFYDENGLKLRVGDVVLVNSEYSTVIAEDKEGDRYIKGVPEDLIIESVVKVEENEDG